MAYDADGNYYWQPDDPIKASTDTSYLRSGATNYSTPGMFGSWGGQAPEAQSQQLIGSPGSYNFANVTDTLNNFASKYKLPTNWNWADAWRAGGGNSGVDLISPLSATARYLQGMDKLQGTNAYGEWAPTIDSKYWAGANAAQAEAKGLGDKASGLNLGQWITPMAVMGGLMGGAGMLSNYLGGSGAGAAAAADTAFPAAGAVNSTMPVVEFGNGAALGGSALTEAGADAAAGANGGGAGMDLTDLMGGGYDSSVQQYLDSLVNGSNSTGWNPSQYSADAADAAQGTGMTSPTNNLLTTQGKMQALMDAGLPWDVVSKIPAGNLGNALNLMKGVMGGSSGSPLSRIMGGNGSTSDWLSLGGAGLGGLLDYMSSSKQADAMKAIADRSWAAGQPYRDRANAAMTPGFDIKSIPGLSSAMDTATETYLRKLSATGGNPAGIGAAPSQTEAFVLGNVALPAWQNYFNANSNAGGLSNLSAQSNATATQSANADAGIYGSLSRTAGGILDPKPDQTQFLRSIFGLA